MTSYLTTLLEKKLSFKVLSLYVLDYKEDPHWYDVSGYAH